MLKRTHIWLPVLSALVLVLGLSVGPSSAGSPETRLTRASLPTQQQATSVYPSVESGKRRISKDRLIRVRSGGCTQVRAIATGVQGRRATYDRSGRSSRSAASSRRLADDSPRAAIFSFRSARIAKDVIARVDDYASRCRGTTKRRGKSVRLRKFRTPDVGEGASVSYRIRTVKRGEDDYDAEVFTRIGNIVLQTSASNPRRPPRKSKVQQFNARQVQASVASSP